MSKFNEPAFPFDGNQTYQPGLTIRQEFVKAAMQGLLANVGAMYSTPDNLLAESAIRIADAVLRREQETRNE